VEAEHVATVTNRVRFGANAGFTGGDISQDGTRIVIKNMVESFLWIRDPASESVGDVLRASPTAPCIQSHGYDGRSSEPSAEKFQGFDEDAMEFKGFLGEAIAFDLDGLGFHTLREGKTVSIHHFQEP